MKERIKEEEERGRGDTKLRKAHSKIPHATTVNVWPYKSTCIYYHFKIGKENKKVIKLNENENKRLQR